jgi:hypothetical protein
VAAQVDVAEHLQVPDRPPLGLVDLVDPALGDRAGRVDQDIGVATGLGEAGLIRADAEVEREDRDRDAVDRLDLLLQFGEPRLVARRQVQRSALGPQPLRDGAADPLRRSRDEGLPPLQTQFQRHLVTSSFRAWLPGLHRHVKAGI